jgi:hypothetical protein
VRAALLVVALAAAEARAEEVPLPLQVQLLSKMATYIINGTQADAPVVKVWILYPGASNLPSRGAQALAAAVEQVGQFGKQAAQSKLVAFLDAKKLEAALAEEKPQFVYLAPELDEKTVAAVVEASTPTAAITVSSVGDWVRTGAILGFTLVEARPQILLNMKQARRQNVSFHAAITRHAVVVER